MSRTTITALLVLLIAGHALAQNPFLTPPSQKRAPEQSTTQVAEDFSGRPDKQNLPVLEGRIGQPHGEHPARPSARPAGRHPSSGPRITPPFFAEIVTLQRELRQRMTDYARQIQERPFAPATWQLMLLSFLYGVIHALV